MAEWQIEPFASSHDRSGFACGVTSLDEFLRVRVSQYERRRLGKTFVAVRPGARRVIGYYTLAAGAIGFDNLPIQAARKLPRHPVPAVLLARLAVDRSAQGQGLGEDLLVDALQRTLSLSEMLGVHAVTVDALDARAAAFYRRYGFESLIDDSQQLYLSVASIRNVLE